jgi:hypothetical protein
MSGTGLYLGPRQLLNFEVPIALSAGLKVTNWPVYPPPFEGTTRLPPTPSLQRNEWKEPTDSEEKS